MKRMRTGARPKPDLGLNQPSLDRSDNNHEDEDEDEDDYMNMIIDDPATKRAETSLQRQKRLRTEAEIRAHPKSQAQLAAESHAQAVAALRNPHASLPSDNRGFKLLSKLGYTPGTALGKQTPKQEEGQEGLQSDIKKPTPMRPMGINITTLDTLDELDAESARKRARIGIGYDEEQRKKIRDAAQEGRRAKKRQERDGDTSHEYDDGNGNNTSDLDDGPSGSSSDVDDDHQDIDHEDVPLADQATKAGRLAARRTRKSVRDKFRTRLRSEHEEKRAGGIFHAAQRIAEELSEKESLISSGAQHKNSGDDGDDSVDSDSKLKLQGQAVPPLSSINVLWRSLVRDRRLVKLTEEEENLRLRKIMTRLDGDSNHDEDEDDDVGSDGYREVLEKNESEEIREGGRMNPHEHGYTARDAYFSTIPVDTEQTTLGYTGVRTCAQTGKNIGSLSVSNNTDPIDTGDATLHSTHAIASVSLDTNAKEQVCSLQQQQQRDGDSDEWNDLDDPELTAFEALPNSERLAQVLSFLRLEFNYCFWCKWKYANSDEMNGDGGCPGPDEGVHG